MKRYAKKDLRKFYKEGDFEKAYSILREIRENYSQSGSMYAIWADLEMRVKNNLSRAEYLLGEAKHFGCPQGHYHLVYGDLLWRKGQFEDALAEYEHSIDAEPSISHMLTFGRALSMADDDRAISVLKEILKKNPENCEARIYLGREFGKLGEYHKALEVLQRAKEIQSSNPSVLLEIGHIYQLLRENNRAIEYYFKAEECGYEKKVVVYAAISDCYCSLGEGTKAIKFAHQAVKIEPENSYACEALDNCKKYALYLCGQGLYVDAYPMIEIAIEIWPNDSEILAYMAVLEVCLKHNYKLGENYMNKAFKYENAELDFLYRLKGFVWFDCLDDKKEGLRCLQKAVSLNPSDYNRVALAHRIIEVDSDKAKKLYEELLASEPKEVDVIYDLAQLAIEQGDLTKGFELAKKACELDPEGTYSNIVLANALFMLEKFQEALELFLKIAERGFYFKSDVYKSIADCYKKLGDSRRARKYTEMANQ